jgi:micrococcal nuclease|tara:strand:+ start:209 stop:517 length:309 start_codon:yes stop_codon:yes gene_type:complete
MRYSYRAKLIRCVDGDTADLDVDLGFYLTARIRCRLTGVNTPERGQANFKEATAILETLIKEQSDEEGYFNITTGKTGKYGRWLVVIDGVNTVLAKRWPYER